MITREQQNHYLNEEKFLLLQSVVMAVQIRDCNALTQLEDHLIPHIASEIQQRGDDCHVGRFGKYLYICRLPGYTQG